MVPSARIYYKTPFLKESLALTIALRRVRGTEDLLTPQKETALARVVMKHLSQWGYQKIKTPILEQTSLFARSLGSETDVVSKEMYTFERGSEGSICLRPEMTASTVRAFYEHTVEQSPWKTFQFGPVFRYERPQKGRLRQFHQFNIEQIDATSPSYDLELITMLDRLWSKLGLTSPVLHINFLGTLEDRNAHRSQLEAFLKPHTRALCETCNVRMKTNLLRIFDCKQATCQELYQGAPKLTDCLSKESEQSWHDMQERLSLLSVSFVHNPFLVRGLDYYNGAVFEFSSELLGAQSAFAGGGRYDLGTILTDKPLPAVGAGIGFERLVLLAEAEGIKFDQAYTPKTLSLIPMEEEHHRFCEQLAVHLIQSGIACSVIFDGSNLKKKLRAANKNKADYTIVIGSDEIAQSRVNLKDMSSGESRTIAVQEIADTLSA